MSAQYGVKAPPSPVHASYAAKVGDFVAEGCDSVVRLLIERAAQHRGNEPQQAQAWRVQVQILLDAFAQVPSASEWSLLLEYSLRRLGRRPDAVLLAPGVVIVIEFKIGDQGHAAQHQRQAEDYALCIRDFHGAVRGLPIVPIVCAESAAARPLLIPVVTDGVSSTLLTNATQLADALQCALAAAQVNGPVVGWKEFDVGSYSPTPTIVQAAREVYAGHTVEEIGRADADGTALENTSRRLRYWATEARERQEHIICLVTGTPGAGKTLLGLNLVLAESAGRGVGEPAVMLTGNRPLVHVLLRALSVDAKTRGETRPARALDSALQTLLGYLRAHASKEAAAPPEHIVVFDEAQRAWDEATGEKLLQRRASEPELFLEVLDRLPWACLVCLVGPGQEINRGEGGIQLWAAALKRRELSGRPWTVVAASGMHELSGQAHIDATMHLAGSLRSYRNATYGEWVDALLDGKIGRAAGLAARMQRPPAYLTRDLSTLKSWLRLRRRGGRRPGLLVSSGAVRMLAEGVPATPMSKDLDKIANWFLKSWPDFRGADSLEVPLSEFGCQGLELDYVGLCWGGDLIWNEQASTWVARRMNAPRWHTIRETEKAQFRLNAYRVLLTRAREGICIYVPHGVDNDETRSSVVFDRISQTLVQAGCEQCTHPGLAATPTLTTT